MLYHFNKVQYKNELQLANIPVSFDDKNDWYNNFSFYELKYHSPDKIMNDNVDKVDANR